MKFNKSLLFLLFLLPFLSAKTRSYSYMLLCFCYHAHFITSYKALEMMSLSQQHREGFCAAKYLYILYDYAIPRGTANIPALLISICNGRFFSLNATVKSFVERKDPRSSIMNSIVTDLSGCSSLISCFICSIACRI